MDKRFLNNFWKVYISKITNKTHAWIIYAETTGTTFSIGIDSDNFCNRLQLFCSNLEINACVVF